MRWLNSCFSSAQLHHHHQTGNSNFFSPIRPSLTIDLRVRNAAIAGDLRWSSRWFSVFVHLWTRLSLWPVAFLVYHRDGLLDPYSTCELNKHDVRGKYQYLLLLLNSIFSPIHIYKVSFSWFNDTLAMVHTLQYHGVVGERWHQVSDWVTSHSLGVNFHKQCHRIAMYGPLPRCH